MNIEKILEFVDKEVPGHAVEVRSAMELLTNAVENTRCAIDGAVGKLATKREYNKANEYIQMSQELAEVVDLLNNYNKKYTLIQDEKLDVPTEDDVQDEIEEVSEKINYEKYRVDEEVAYNLYTDFTHKKPAAFSIDGKKYPARKWQYVFVQTCELLVKKDPEIFNTFVMDGMMQGRSRAYFSLVPEDIRKPKKIVGTNIYIETNLSANTIRNIIINMLEKYNISKTSYQIYLSKDLTPLHEDYEIKELKKVEPEIKKEDDSEKEKANSVYTSNPDDFRFVKERHADRTEYVFKRVNESIGTPSHIEYLKMSENDTKRHKSRCVEYDKKKKVCMCVRSPYFTMKCGGSSHCKFYAETEAITETKPSMMTQGFKKEKIRVVPVEIHKQRKCTKCEGKTERELLDVTYTENGKSQNNKLPIYRCSSCGKAFLPETVFRTYTSNKKVENINVEFIKGKTIE